MVGKRIAVLLSVMVAFFLLLPIVRADELDDITRQIEQLKTELTSKETNQQQVRSQVQSIQSSVEAIEADIVKKQAQVEQGEKDLIEQKLILNERAKSYYKNINKNSQSLLMLLAGGNFSVSFNNFFYQKTIIDQDRNIIIRLALFIKNLEDTKKELQSERVRLAQVKVTLDEQVKIIDSEIETARSQIAQLSQQQQNLIAQKQSSLGIPKSVGSSASGGCSSDLTNGKDPGFSPRVGFFTYGVPNRVGLNQYGAKGRAEAGQNVEEILNAYYANFELKKDYDQNIQIDVEGHGTYSIEEYVKRIYEIPESWPMETLKAQAIAARSYALSYTGNGSKSICTTESCQVFKPDPKGGAWDAAVEATKGWVMMSGGSPVTAWFSSTHGGYVYTSSEIGWNSTGWTKSAQDTNGGISGFGDLQSNAYDKESPWFYCNWGARGEHSNTAWMKPEEVADIFNVIELARRDSGVVDHLYQPDKPHPSGGEVWDREKVKNELKSRGGSPLSSVTNVSVGVDFGSGKTNSLSAGGISATGSEFKSWFNLRAPANIQIVGPLYNVETQ